MHVVLTVCFLGCGGGGPGRPPFDPEASGREAMAAYDSNTDGAIDETEAEASPGLVAAFASIDTDGDKQLTEQEIASRVNYYKSAPTIISQGEVKVFYKNKPVEGATVTMEPEPFLGEAFKICEGVTNYNGVASIKGHDAAFPGIYLGFYRVRISRVNDKGKELLPTKFNEESTLGYESTDDQNMDLAQTIEFRLK